MDNSWSFPDDLITRNKRKIDKILVSVKLSEKFCHSMIALWKVGILSQPQDFMFLFLTIKDLGSESSNKSI